MASPAMHHPYPARSSSPTFRQRANRVISRPEEARVSRPQFQQTRRASAAIVTDRAEPVEISRPEPVEISRPSQSGCGSYRTRCLLASRDRDLSNPSFHHDSYDSVSNDEDCLDFYESQQQQYQQQQQVPSHSRGAMSSSGGTGGSQRRSFLMNGNSESRLPRRQRSFPNNTSNSTMPRRQRSFEDYGSNGAVSTMDTSYSNSNRLANSNYSRNDSYSNLRNNRLPPRNVSMGSSSGSNHQPSNYSPPSRNNVSRSNTRGRISSQPYSPPTAPTPPKVSYVEIEPGVQAPLRTTEETLDAIARNFVTPAPCFGCEASLYCIADAKLLICPECRVVSPVFLDNGAENNGHGVGLGFTRETLLASQADAVLPSY